MSDDLEMARKVGSSGPKTDAAIREAGLRLIYRNGFAATGLQQLATEVGIQKSSIYNYISSKQALLFEIVQGHMNDLLEAAERELLPVDAPAQEQLAVFVRFHVLYHMEHRMEMFVSNSELRSLEGPNLKTVLDLRAAYEAKLISMLAQGEQDGTFRVPDVTVAAFGILAMLSSVGSWFKADGRLSREEVAGVFTQMVQRSLGA